MRLFSALYTRVLRWASHQHASWYLAGLSFAESSFFPIPPDVMLAPMTLARQERAWRYATITTLASVAGGALGYMIGQWAFDAIEPWVHYAGYWEHYQQAKGWFDAWGVWVILIAGFSPIPYKVFTIAAGTVSMAFLPFVVVSAVGRGARFFLVAALMRWGGARMDKVLRQYIDHLGWLVILAAVVVLVLQQG